MDFEAIADDLYARAPTEFVSARTDAVKQARAAGDRELAARIQGLSKPTVSAWAVNQLMREHHAEMGVLLDLGRELRAGLSGVTGDELRQLTKRRHQLIAGLIDLARQTCAAHGQKLTEASAAAVRATLEATLSDGDNSEAVRVGRLTEALQSSGFGFGMPSMPASATEPDPQPGSSVSDLDSHRKRKEDAVAKARAELESAEQAAEEAEASRDAADKRLRQATADRDELIDSIAQLRRKLERATGKLDQASAKVKKRKSAKSDADRLAREAELERADAEQRLARLT